MVRRLAVDRLIDGKGDAAGMSITKRAMLGTAALLVAGLAAPGAAHAQTCPPSVAFSEAAKTAASRFEQAVRGSDASKLRRIAGSPLDEHMEGATFIQVGAKGKARVRAEGIIWMCGTKGDVCDGQPRIKTWGDGRVEDLRFPANDAESGECILTFSVPVPRLDRSSDLPRPTARDTERPQATDTKAEPPIESPTAPPAPQKAAPRTETKFPSPSEVLVRGRERADPQGRRFAIVQGRVVPLTKEGFVDMEITEAPRSRDDAEADVVPFDQLVVGRDGRIGHFASREQLEQFRKRAVAGLEDDYGPDRQQSRQDPAIAGTQPAKAPEVGTADDGMSRCRGQEFKTSGFSWMSWIAYQKGILPNLPRLRKSYGEADEIVYRVKLYKGGMTRILDSWGSRGGVRQDGRRDYGNDREMEKIFNDNPPAYGGQDCEVQFALPLEPGLRFNAFSKNRALR